MICIGGEEKLNNFQTNLNTKHVSINEKSTHSIAFLETLIYTEENHSKQIYTKTHQRSQLSHPTHFKDILSNPKAIRQRRVSTDHKELKNKNKSPPPPKKNPRSMSTLFAWAYTDTITANQTTRAISTSRQDTLKLRTKVKMNRNLSVIAFNNTLPSLAQISKKC